MKKWLILIGGAVMGVILTLVITNIANSENDTPVDEVNNTPQVNYTWNNGDMEIPGEIINVKSFKVFQVCNQIVALAHGQDRYGNYTGTVYLLENKKEDLYSLKVSPFYDDQIVNVPKGKVARLFGTHHYFTNNGQPKTVPIVRIVDK